jgi:hypothetical protein
MYHKNYILQSAGTRKISPSPKFAENLSKRCQNKNLGPMEKSRNFVVVEGKLYCSLMVSANIVFLT